MELADAELNDMLTMKVDRLFSKWIHRLRLRDWTVSWKIVRKEDLPEHRAGRCDFILLKKTAVIRIIHPDDASKEWLDPFDVESTVVHELMHLHLAPWSMLFDQNDQALVFLEQTVHTLSSTFLSADRADRHWTNFPEFCGVQDPRSVVR